MTLFEQIKERETKIAQAMSDFRTLNKGIQVALHRTHDIDEYCRLARRRDELKDYIACLRDEQDSDITILVNQS